MKKLVWEDVSVMANQSYSLKMSSSKSKGSLANKKKLLNGLSGFALHGRILAIMGPSGSGKSTLLDALSGIYTSLTPSLLISLSFQLISFFIMISLLILLCAYIYIYIILHCNSCVCSGLSLAVFPKQNKKTGKRSKLDP